MTFVPDTLLAIAVMVGAVMSRVKLAIGVVAAGPALPVVPIMSLIVLAVRFRVKAPAAVQPVTVTVD